MKLEQSERLFVETLFNETITRQKIEEQTIFEIDRLTGDASTRRYYRVETGQGPFVVCLDNPLREGEVHPFMDVHELLEQHEVKVPKIYDVDLQKGYFLEEDLGDRTFLHFLADMNSPDDELQYYKQAIDLMCSIHSIPSETFKNRCCGKLAFDYKKLMEEMDFTLHHFIHSFLGRELSTDEELVLRKGFKNICQELAEQEMVLTHRDYHSRNLMIRNQDELVTIDFQDARLGIPQYDLVSLLEDCYYELADWQKQELKRYYWDKFLKPSGLQKEYKDYEYYYDLMTVQRVFKAIGSFSYIFSLRKDLRYVKYIGFAFEKVKRLMYLFPEMNDLRQLLTRIYYEN